MLHQHSTSKSELNLDSADHKEIDSFITSPSLYTVISAYNNQLAHIPIEIEKLTQLQMLDLRHNKINHIIDEIGKLKELQSLYLNDNNLEKLQYALSELSNLLYLNATDNNLK